MPLHARNPTGEILGGDILSDFNCSLRDSWESRQKESQRKGAQKKEERTDGKRGRVDDRRIQTDNEPK